MVHGAEQADLSGVNTEIELTFAMNPQARSVTHLECSDFYGGLYMLSVHKGRKTRRNAGQGVRER